MTDSPSWGELYAAAMLELDHIRLKSRIAAAQIAIRQSMEKLRGNCALGAVDEIQALTAALGNLQTLQRVEFRVPTPSGAQSLSSNESVTL